MIVKLLTLLKKKKERKKEGTKREVKLAENILLTRRLGITEIDLTACVCV